MQPLGVIRVGFDGVREGVAQIEQGARARAAGLRFAFILRDDGRFHLAAAADRVTQRGLIEREQGFEILFEPGKESGITEHAVLDDLGDRSEEHTSELQSLMRISYAVFCLKKKKKQHSKKQN